MKIDFDLLIPENALVLDDTENCIIRPVEIDIQDGLSSTFGKLEREDAATTIVKWCQLKDRWTPFTLEEISRFHKTLGNKRDFAFCGLCEPWFDIDRMYKVSGGWIVKKDDQYYITIAFVKCVYLSHGIRTFPITSSN